MSRYIDADELERKYMSADYMDNDTAYDVIAEIDTAPHIDIVRCKDCKWSSPNGKNGCALVPFARINDRHYMYADDYCSYGERESEPLDYCKKRNCIWWSRSLKICLAERSGLVCKYKSGKE